MTNRRKLSPAELQETGAVLATIRGAVEKSATADTLKTAREIAERSADAYMADAYTSWAGVAALLLARKFTPLEVEAIMRSKWMRWAADTFEGGRSHNVPARAITEYIDRYVGRNTLREVEKLADELAAERV